MSIEIACCCCCSFLNNLAISSFSMSHKAHESNCNRHKAQREEKIRISKTPSYCCLSILFGSFQVCTNVASNGMNFRRNRVACNLFHAIRQRVKNSAKINGPLLLNCMHEIFFVCGVLYDLRFFFS